MDDDEVFTSVLVPGEIRRGIESIRRRDVASALAIEQWLVRLATGLANGSIRSMSASRTGGGP